MPIKSLQNATAPALPRLGKLRKGGQKPARGLGQDLTYFRFTAEDGNPEVEAAFREIYGDEPAMLRVYLPYADVASNFESWMEQWGGGERLLHRCDGEYCVKWLGEDGRYVFEHLALQGWRVHADLASALAGEQSLWQAADRDLTANVVLAADAPHASVLLAPPLSTETTGGAAR